MPMSGFALPAPEAGRYGEIEGRFESDMATTFLMDAVAIKGVPPDAEPVKRERLALEAKILGDLDHPQIPALIEDRTDEEVPYFVMTKAPGMPSRSVVMTFPGSEFAARTISSVLQPLSYVHDRDFVHRDIKPDNMVAQRSGRVALIDFGAATPRPYGHLIESGEMEEGPSEHARARDHALRYGSIFNGGKYVVSADYMSPEQSDNSHVDITSDFYNLGITAYELFYGRVPFQVNISRRINSAAEDAAFDAVLSPAQQRISELARMHKEASIDLTVPEGREIPGAVVSFIERATQKDPADRYQSAEEMLEDVDIALRAAA